MLSQPNILEARSAGVNWSVQINQTDHQGLGTSWHQDNAYFGLSDGRLGTAMWTVGDKCFSPHGQWRPPRTFRNIPNNVEIHVALPSVIFKTQLYAAPNLNMRSNCTQHLVVILKSPHPTTQAVHDANLSNGTLHLVPNKDQQVRPLGKKSVVHWKKIAGVES